MLTVEALTALFALAQDILKMFKGDAQAAAIVALRRQLASQIQVDIQAEIDALGK